MEKANLKANLDYSEELYRQYLKDPLSVEDSWRWFFKGFHQGLEKSITPLDQKGLEKSTSQLNQQGLEKSTSQLNQQGLEKSTSPQTQSAFPDQKGLSAKDLEKELRVLQMLEYYRDQGSLKARLDPLNNPPPLTPLEPEDFQITESDLNRIFRVSETLLGLNTKLKNVIDFLEEKYCGTIALQVSTCPPKIKQWFFKEFEQETFSLTKAEKIQAFKELAKAVGLEQFLQLYFPGKKRFSLEGLDALIPMLDFLLERGSTMGMQDLIIGMSHRGRINVLINILGQNPQALFSEFEPSTSGRVFDKKSYTQDVKYHLGFSSQRKTKQGICSLYLGYNPSHLESIGPVICGVSRAIQRKNKDTLMRKSALPVLIHGDAAFCGQGCVSETLQLSKLKGYTVGGSLHIILNNQLGFTTEPKDARSSLFTSDLAKSIEAPVLLVNADDLPACLRAIDMAARFRHHFGEDVFIELIGYRKYGHNEGDEPSFTQPALYRKIKKQEGVLSQFSKSLIQEGVLSQAEKSKITLRIAKSFEEHLQSLRRDKPVFSKRDYVGRKQELQKATALKKFSLSEKQLKKVLRLISEEPKSVQLHPKIKKILAKRRQKIQEDQLDWALCELSAYASLIEEGFSVRLTGQDSERGTFSHRHAIYYDYETGKGHSPLKQRAKAKGLEFCLYNSPLSEMAVLAFEYGNSCLAPDFLTLWEAQFGDFVNGAQILIDQFISSGELKWLQSTDIVLLLPHAYEGQGPEHSSAYLERFLQLAAQNNMRVCNLTKPSNFFHALRRQKMLVEERKPLIVMTPKSLLRHPEVVSSSEDLLSGSFEELICDRENLDPRDIRTLILCSGKVYYDLKPVLSHKKDRAKNALLCRLEQLYPFPDQALNPILNGFPCLSKILWLQEEPQNRGAWFFVKDQLEQMMKNLNLQLDIRYKGRPRLAAAAEGSEQIHRQHQAEIIESCLSDI